ncbi:MAG TPA: hypothetical protein VK638_38505, partial [Edaphobacter sp.]|nr:hypothetical protein [Edaphobacter sp.]
FHSKKTSLQMQFSESISPLHASRRRDLQKLIRNNDNSKDDWKVAFTRTARQRSDNQQMILLLWFLACSIGLAQTASDGGIPDANFLPPVIRPAPPLRQYGEPWLTPRQGKGVDWDGLAKQSGMFLAVEHSFRVMTEPGTREGMSGPFWKGYMQAVGNLHGWSDGDEFYVNYVGHSIQGAVSGFIWVQNDRDYRAAEFGKNRLYWKSRLRAAAFSAAYSTQFEIGPLSEASIGKVQRIYPQQGLVDHVVTPVIGTAWMLAEDAIDKYVIRRFENRVQNHTMQALVRGFLNPTRSFANMMRLKQPWIRETRPNPWDENLQRFLTAQKAGLVQFPTEDAPPIEGEFGVALAEVSMNARSELFSRDGITPCMGGGAELDLRLNPDWQLVADISGCKLLGLEDRWSGDTLSYMAGPRWTPRSSSRWSPYAQVLLGGMKVTTERDRKGTLEQSTAERATFNNFAMKMGGGVDLRVHPALAFRVANLEYKHIWTGQPNAISDGFSMTMGVVLRYGTW